MAIKLRNDGVEFGDGSLQNTAISANVIFMWYGSIESIPAGWALCDGSNGTPDLRDRFVIGAGSEHPIGNTGGTANLTVLTHTHAVTFVANGNHSHNMVEFEHFHGDIDFEEDGYHVHPGPYSLTTNPDGTHVHDFTELKLASVDPEYNTPISPTFTGHTHLSYFPSTGSTHRHFVYLDDVSWEHEHNYGYRTASQHWANYQIPYLGGIPYQPVILYPDYGNPTLTTTGLQPNGQGSHFHGHTIPSFGEPGSTNNIHGYHRHYYTLEPDNPANPLQNYGDHQHTFSIETYDHPAHNHQLYFDSIQPDGDHFHEGAYTINPSNTPTDEVNLHSHTFSINPSGVTAAGGNLPPYYCLAFIMKL